MTAHLLQLTAGGGVSIRGPFDSLLDATLAGRGDQPGALLDATGAVVCFRGECLPSQRRRLRQCAEWIAAAVTRDAASTPTASPPCAELDAMVNRLMRVFHAGRRR